MRALLLISVLGAAWLSPRAAGAQVASATAAEDRGPRPSDWITPGRTNLSGEDPMFPDRTSSREPPPPRSVRRRVARPAEAPAALAIGQSRVELEVGLLAVNRSLSFVHLPGSTLRGHEVSLAPALGLAARVFPIPRTAPFFSELGLYFAHWRTAELRSVRVEGGPEIPTVLTSMELGLRYRVELGRLLPGLELTPLASFQRSSSLFGTRGAAAEGAVPSIDYLGGKFGLEARMRLKGPVSIETELAFSPVLGTGNELVSSRFFAGASGYGVLARARFGMALSPFAQLLVGAELQSFSLDLEPGPALAVLAADRSLLVSLGVRFTEPLSDE